MSEAKAKPKLTEEQLEITRYVLYWYGHPKGWSPGGFIETLMSAYTKADLTNKARFRLGFPELSEAMDLVNNQLGGLDKLAKRLD